MSEKTKKTVLIIDDEPDVRVYLQAALEDGGYSVLAAGSARQGLAMAEADRPDVICLDIVMPGQTGISLYQTLRLHRSLRSVPIIIISGMSAAQEESSFDLLKLKVNGTPDLPGPDAFIEKPINLQTFLQTVQRLSRC